MQFSLQNHPIVTVVMPVFNERGTLETILRAVLNQPCVAESDRSFHSQKMNRKRERMHGNWFNNI